jgi:hypothetical protein
MQPAAYTQSRAQDGCGYAARPSLIGKTSRACLMRLLQMSRCRVCAGAWVGDLVSVSVSVVTVRLRSPGSRASRLDRCRRTVHTALCQLEAVWPTDARGMGKAIGVLSAIEGP